MTPRLGGLFVALCLIGAAPGPIAGFKPVSFTETTRLASNGEMARRLLSPFAYADLARKNDAAVLRDAPIDPKKEKFGLFVPREKPDRGYGLVVWVSPLDGAGMPLGWADTLEKRGVIFVTAARSGNDTSPLGRRIPLALTAAANVARKYPIDPERIWIAGFSGGARIAERIAVAYPDVFTGAILDGSMDNLGSPDLPLPAREQFDRLLDRTAMVLSTGQADDYNTRDAKRVVANLRSHCIERLSIEVRPREGHVMMNGASLAKAIEFLDRPRELPSPESEQCREQLYSTVDAELARAEAMVRQGDRGARGMLKSIDSHYGALAGPRLLELSTRVGR